MGVPAPVGVPAAASAPVTAAPAGTVAGAPTAPVAPATPAASAPVVQPVASNVVTIEPLLEECIKRDASDLHLQAGLPPILRLDGVLHPVTTYAALSNEDVQRLVFSTLDEEQQKILIKDKEFDYSFAFGDLGRFRVNAFHEKGNMAAAFRLIPNVVYDVGGAGG